MRLGGFLDASTEVTKSPEFRQRAVDLARLREKPIASIAGDVPISESCLRRWIGQADIDAGHRPGLTGDERAELVQLRRETVRPSTAFGPDLTPGEFPGTVGPIAPAGRHPSPRSA